MAPIWIHARKEKRTTAGDVRIAIILLPQHVGVYSQRADRNSLRYLPCCLPRIAWDAIHIPCYPRSFVAMEIEHLWSRLAHLVPHS